MQQDKETNKDEGRKENHQDRNTQRAKGKEEMSDRWNNRFKHERQWGSPTPLLFLVMGFFSSHFLCSFNFFYGQFVSLLSFFCIFVVNFVFLCLFFCHLMSPYGHFVFSMSLPTSAH